jgi:Protein of unknown function (DUF2631)
MVSTEVERSTDVDPAEVPSAAWGWSKINHRTWHIAGLIIIGFLLMTLHGNHVGKVEDIFVIVFAGLAAIFLIRDIWGRRRGWIR